eukprot:1079863-Rhodomonas_salina.2
MSGKVRTMGVNRAYYFVVFANDATNYKFVATMHTKDKFIPKLDYLLLRICKTPSILRSDNAGEMTGEMAKQFYKKNCIVHQTCCVYQHEGN